MHQGAELHQTLPHLLVALSEESNMRPWGDIGSEMPLPLPILPLRDPLSQRKMSSMWDRDIAKSTKKI